VVAAVQLPKEGEAGEEAVHHRLGVEAAGEEEEEQAW